MLSDRKTLEQSGSNCFQIFAPIRGAKVVDSEFEPHKNGFKKEFGVICKPVRSHDNVVGYEIYQSNPYTRRMMILEAQNCGRFLEQSLRSMHVNCREILTTIGELSKTMS